MLTRNCPSTVLVFRALSLAIGVDLHGSMWTGEARTQVKVSSTPYSESAWICTDSESFRADPLGTPGGG
jgi:hypothetical protein